MNVNSTNIFVYTLDTVCNLRNKIDNALVVVKLHL